MSTPGPSSAAKFRPNTPSGGPSSAAAAASGQQQDAAGGGSFTAEMRDRQARGKDPYVKERSDDDDDDEDDEMMDDDDDDEEDDDDEMDVDADDEDDDDEESVGEAGGRRRRMRLGRGPKPEPFEDRERRSFALSVLDNPEQLMMYAQSTGDSIPGQRRRFMAILCGFGSFSDVGAKTPARRR